MNAVELLPAVMDSRMSKPISAGMVVARRANGASVRANGASVRSAGMSRLAFRLSVRAL